MPQEMKQNSVCTSVVNDPAICHRGKLHVLLVGEVNKWGNKKKN